MKKTAIMAAAVFLASLVPAGFSMAAGEYGTSGSQKMQSQTSPMSQAGQEQIRTASELQNFTVQDSQGKKIGKVDKVAVDLKHGRIGYVTVSGSEGKDFIIPWQALNIEPQQKTLVVNMSASQLMQAPKGNLDQALTREKAQQIHQFYGVAPYWESTGTQEPGMMQHPGTTKQPGKGM